MFAVRCPDRPSGADESEYPTSLGCLLHPWDNVCIFCQTSAEKRTRPLEFRENIGTLTDVCLVVLASFLSAVYNDKLQVSQ